MFLVDMQLFISSRTHFHVRCPMCFISFAKILPRTMALPFLKGFDADIELFKGEWLSQSGILGVLKSYYFWSWLFGGGFPVEQQLMCNLVDCGCILLLCWC